VQILKAEKVEPPSPTRQS